MFVKQLNRLETGRSRSCRGPRILLIPSCWPHMTPSHFHANFIVLLYFIPVTWSIEFSTKRPILFLNTSTLLVVRSTHALVVQAAWFSHMVRVTPHKICDYSGSSRNSSFWGIQEISSLSCLAVRTNQAPGTFLVGTTSLKCQACCALPRSAQIRILTCLGPCGQRRPLCPHGPKQVKDGPILVGIVGWDGLRGLIWLGVHFWKMENFTGFAWLGGAGCGRIYFGEAILDQVG